MDNLKPSRAADRAKIADILRQTAEAAGATVDVVQQWPAAGRCEAMVTVSMGGVAAGIRVGELSLCVPWHVTPSCPERLSAAFGYAAGGPVNPFHRRKCTTFPGTLSDTVRRLEMALACIADGTAFIKD